MAAPTVQIFGVKNSSATRAAERFFKERRFQIHYVDLQKKPLAAGEVKRFVDKFGGLTALLVTEGKEYADAGLKYLRVTDVELLARGAVELRQGDTLTAMAATKSWCSTP